MKCPTIAVAAFVGISLSGCFAPGWVKDPELPRAEATAKFRKTRDAETRIDLAVRHLRHPEQLVPPGHIYVAWVRRDKEAPALNIGALVLDKDLDGELHVLTPLKRFDLFVTAESSLEIDSPTGVPLLWTRHED